MNVTRAPLWAGIILLLAASIIYLLTLDNGLRPGELAGGDLITHQYAQVQGRPSNAPGYPLYTMGGWLWFHGWRSLLGADANATAILSAYSTLWALAALALLYATLVKVTRNWPLSLLLSAFYAVTYFFWFYAASTEQYASAVAHTLAIALVAFVWEDGVERAGGASTPTTDRCLLLLAFLCGLTLAHMVTVAFIAPPLLWFVLSRQPGMLRRPRLVGAAALLFCIPLLSYAFVFIRGAQHPEWRGAGEWTSTWVWFVDFVSTSQGRSELTWSLRPLWTSEFPALIWRELTWVGLLGGIGGLAALGRRRGVFLGATLLIYLAFSFVDRLGNWYQVIMPAYALLMISFGAALQWLWQRLAGATRPQRLGRAALLAGLLLLIGLRAAWSLPAANQRDRPEDTALLPGQAILADEPAAGAAVMGVYTETLSLRYLTDIAGLRPDVTAVDSAAARTQLAADQPPLYVTNAAVPLLWQEVSADARLSSAGATLIQARSLPASEIPPEIQPLEDVVGDGLALAGYAVQPAGDDWPGRWRVRLVWRAQTPIGNDWSVSVRPTRSGELVPLPEGGIVQQDLPHPVHGFYPTTRWMPGEIVVDDYVLTLPDGPSPDGWQVVVYRPLDGGFENLAVLHLPAPLSR